MPAEVVLKYRFYSCSLPPFFAIGIPVMEIDILQSSESSSSGFEPLVKYRRHCHWYRLPERGAAKESHSLLNCIDACVTFYRSQISINVISRMFLGSCAILYYFLS